MPKLCCKSVRMNKDLETKKSGGEFRVCKCMHDVSRRNDAVRREMDGSRGCLRWTRADPRSVHRFAASSQTGGWFRRARIHGSTFYRQEMEG